MAITTSQTGAHIVGKGSQTAAGPGPYIMASSTLEGDHVFTSDNEDVGKIKEVMLDVERGKIAYAVMSCGGFLGIGDKLMALPWAALTLDTTHKCFILNVTSERIKTAPGFDKDHWPVMADIGWATTLHEYYGTRAHWDEPVSPTGEEPLREPPVPPEAGGVKL
ncbi:PRC-barrel domain-containing protein [Paraburkholderia sp. A2WS-5]|uniref:PRC-barrel domain-containing protein n=1 Tax=unclassified Paraburkholderia TaxID=2615204 RepID=UPI003B7CA842